MEPEIVKSEKDDLEVRVYDSTLVELLRHYLNEQGVKFSAWRKESSNGSVLFKVQSSGKTAKKAISDAVSAIKKDSDRILKVLKK